MKTKASLGTEAPQHLQPEPHLGCFADVTGEISVLVSLSGCTLYAHHRLSLRMHFDNADGQNPAPGPVARRWGSSGGPRRLPLPAPPRGTALRALRPRGQRSECGGAGKRPGAAVGDSGLRPHLAVQEGCFPRVPVRDRQSGRLFDLTARTDSQICSL